MKTLRGLGPRSLGGLWALLVVGLNASAANAAGEVRLVSEALDPSGIWLVLPEFGPQQHPPGVVRLPGVETVQRLDLHIPIPRALRIHTRLNTVAAGVVQTLSARAGEVVCRIDLRQHQARYFALGEKDNTVEIEVVEEAGDDPVYARWVLAPPRAEPAWRNVETASSSGGGAALGAGGIAILEQLPGGRWQPLEQGLTTAHRVRVQVSFARTDATPGLRVRWHGEGDAVRTLVAGRESGGGRGVEPREPTAPMLQLPVELSIGRNELAVATLHGDRVLTRSSYRVIRRARLEPAEVQGDRWAVLVGISEYRSEEIADLAYAHADAESMRTLLVERAGFSADRVLLLVDEQASAQSIRSALSTFLAATRPDDLVVVFWAGHGVQDPKRPGRFFFLAEDSVPNDLGGTAIPMLALGNALDYSVRAGQVVLIADTCHAGSSLATADGARELNFFNKYLENLARKKGRLVLTASRAHETSREDPGSGHGFFTAHLVAGLEGQADRDHDGIVTAGELVDHLELTVPAATAGGQHPAARSSHFDMALPMAYMRSADPPQP